MMQRAENPYGKCLPFPPSKMAASSYMLEPIMKFESIFRYSHNAPLLLTTFPLTHTHTHTRSHSFLHFRTHTPTLILALDHARILILTHTRSHSCSYSHSHSHSRILTHTHSHSLSLTLIVTHTPAHSNRKYRRMWRIIRISISCMYPLCWRR